MNFGFYNSDYGITCIAFDNEFLYAVLFVSSKEEGISDLKRRFKNIVFEEDNQSAQKIGDEIFKINNLSRKLKLTGTEFQKKVWEALLQIPEGETSTYAIIAASIGKPTACRAVGTAIGANPLAFLVPCHRVLRTDGGIGGYHWGIEIKKMMLRNEEVKNQH
ncbi:hypothetical protein MASR2M117_15750 [Paludibacter sp.]